MPRAIGDEIVREMIHVIPSIMKTRFELMKTRFEFIPSIKKTRFESMKTRFEFLCLAYLMGCVTAMNLQPQKNYFELV